MHDVSQGSTANKVKRVTSYKGESGLGPRRQHRYVVRRNNDDLVHDISRVTGWREKIHDVAKVNVLEPPEKSFDVSDSAVQRQVVGTFEHRYFEIDGGNPEHAQRTRRTGDQAGLISLNPFLRPETEIWDCDSPERRISRGPRGSGLITPECA